MAGEIADVIAGDPIEAAWGNAIRDRVLSRYATAAARDAANATPSTGDQAWLTTEAEPGGPSPGIRQIFDGIGWISQPRGDVGLFSGASGAHGVEWWNTTGLYADFSLRWDVSGTPNGRLRGELLRGAGLQTIMQVGGGGADSWFRHSPGQVFSVRTTTGSARVLDVAEDSVAGDGTGAARAEIAANNIDKTDDSNYNTTGVRTARNILIADVAPEAGDGKDGDVWFWVSGLT